MDEDNEDAEDDDPQPDAYSTLYDPLGGIRERMGRLPWWQRALLVLGAWVVVVAIALLVTLRNIR